MSNFVTNQQPTAANDLATTAQGISVTINVAANDLDLDGDDLTITILTQPVSGTAQVNNGDPEGDPLTVTLVTQPANGTAIVNGNQIVYTPIVSFTGRDSFTYRITDKGGLDTATVSITVINPDLLLPSVVK